MRGDFSQHGPYNAFNDSPRNGWIPNTNDASTVWIGVEFDAPTHVRMIRADGLGVGGRGRHQYSSGVELQCSDDGKNWETVGQEINNNIVSMR